MKDILKDNKNRKRNAVQRGLEYRLHHLTLNKLYNIERCYYLNLPLNVKIERFAKDTKLTLDRKNPKHGYTKHNCHILTDTHIIVH